MANKSMSIANKIAIARLCTRRVTQGHTECQTGACCISLWFLETLVLWSLLLTNLFGKEDEAELFG